MEIQGNSISLTSAALSGLSPGQKQLPAVDVSLPLHKAEGIRSDRPSAEALEKARQKAEAEKPPITYEERLKQMISADELRRLLFLYSPFTRNFLAQEKGQRLDRIA